MDVGRDKDINHSRSEDPFSKERYYFRMLENFTGKIKKAKSDFLS